MTTMTFPGHEGVIPLVAWISVYNRRKAWPSTDQITYIVIKPSDLKKANRL